MWNQVRGRRFLFVLYVCMLICKPGTWRSGKLSMYTEEKSNHRLYKIYIGRTLFLLCCDFRILKKKTQSVCLTFLAFSLPFLLQFTLSLLGRSPKSLTSPTETDSLFQGKEKI